MTCKIIFSQRINFTNLAYNPIYHESKQLFSCLIGILTEEDKTCKATSGEKKNAQEDIKNAGTDKT